MPFDPRLIPPDDAPLGAGGELDLPDDLAVLAWGLTDDAARLAARYPADRQPHAALAVQLAQSATRIEAASRRRRTWQLVAVLAGGGLASLAAIAIVLSSGMRQGADRPASRFTAAQSPATAAPAATGPAANLPAALAPSGPSVSLGELSAPEMEAVFDLLQQDSPKTGSISF